jgi:ABC-type Fe3+/spermidine/putrescine transport system ATPase subunit
MNPALQIQQIIKSFEGKRALDGVSFDVYPGEIVALLGPSGCGKSTLLMLIAGLDTPDTGDILWQGASLVNALPHTRSFGLMFQDYALFPHLDAAANVAFGLRYQELEEQEADARVTALLDLVNMSGFEKRDITSLSGGEQQRVALARSLAPRPRLLMLDEPLGALDTALRERLLTDLQNILRELNQTAIYVTHDQAEAFAMADRIVVMKAGRVEQIGTARDIYLHPDSRFVAEFLGFDNFLKGSLEVSEGKYSLKTPFVTGAADVLLRPDGAQLDRPDVVPGFSGVIQKKTFRGTVQRVRIETDTGVFRFNFPITTNLPSLGSSIQIGVEREAIQVFPITDA